jgi:hypothetical protein
MILVSARVKYEYWLLDDAAAVPLKGMEEIVPLKETELLDAEAGLVPALLVAVTAKLYAVPLLNPVTEIGLDAPSAVTLPGVEVTV